MHAIRSRGSILFKVSCLSLLHASAWSQALPPCPSKTQARIVANTNDTAALATSLQCSNGSIDVQWYGDVVVSQTIYITQGTSLNITGTSTGATADGNHITQLFAVNSTSSLLLTDMTLANGDADNGGAVHATEQASISFGGNMTFASNTAWYGGAIYAGPSASVFWDGEHTKFIDNSASYYGGAIMVEGSSDVSWDGETVFVNNSAKYGGGQFLSARHQKCLGGGKRRSRKTPLGSAVQCTRSLQRYCGMMTRPRLSTTRRCTTEGH